MSARADQYQIRRWQDEVASDPGAASFLPLAEVYRREGRSDVAMRLCLRGLQRYPENVDAHFLLGRLYRDAGETEKALDEWDIALRLDAGHRPSRRALGYLHLERREWLAAIRHLEPLAEASGDERLENDLRMARRQLAREAASAGAARQAQTLEQAVAAPIERFVRAARVRRVLLTDGSGRVLARTGFSNDDDVAAFATLAAGVQSAATAIAGVLGQRRFEQLYQGAGERQIFMATVQTPAGEMNLLAVFGSDTTIGLVRVLFRDLAGELDELPWVPPPTRPRTAADFEVDLASGLGNGAGGGPRLMR